MGKSFKMTEGDMLISPFLTFLLGLFGEINGGCGTRAFVGRADTAVQPIIVLLDASEMGLC